jgi:hypothetical protein
MMLAGEFDETQIVGWFAGGDSDFVRVGILLPQAAQNGLKRRRLFEIVIRNTNRAQFTQFGHNAFCVFGGFYFQIDESSSGAQSVREDFYLMIDGTFEVPGGVVVAAGGKKVRVGIGSTKFAKHLNARGWIWQVIQAEFKERTAIFVFAFSGALQLAGGRQTQRDTDAR